MCLCVWKQRDDWDGGRRIVSYTNQRPSFSFKNSLTSQDAQSIFKNAEGGILFSFDRTKKQRCITEEKTKINRKRDGGREID